MQDIERHITTYFESVGDATFAKWDKRIIATSLPIVGVRLLVIKKTAQELVKRGLAGEIIDNASISCYEMLLLRGFLIAYDRADEDTTLHRLHHYLVDVDNWQCVDNIVSAVRLHDDRYYDFLIGELNGESEWHIRYGIVGLMTYFDERQEKALSRILGVTVHSYYVDMAIAWAISVAYINLGTRIFGMLDSATNITPEVLKYAKGKVRDSYRIDRDAKYEFLRYSTSRTKSQKGI